MPTSKTLERSSALGVQKPLPGSPRSRRGFRFSPAVMDPRRCGAAQSRNRRNPKHRHSVRQWGGAGAGAVVVVRGAAARCASAGCAGAAASPAARAAGVPAARSVLPRRGASWCGWLGGTTTIGAPIGCGASCAMRHTSGRPAPCCRCRGAGALSVLRLLRRHEVPRISAGRPVGSRAHERRQRAAHGSHAHEQGRHAEAPR